LVKIYPINWIHAETRNARSKSPTTSDIRRLLREIFANRGLKPEYYIELRISEYIIGFNSVLDARKAAELHGSHLGITAMAIFVEAITSDENSSALRVYF
jgi:hypothetical protein